MIEKIISGGQTGVDRAALDVALELGIPCGGWCPKGRKAEDGPIDPRYHNGKQTVLKEGIYTSFTPISSWGFFIFRFIVIEEKMEGLNCGRIPRKNKGLYI